MAGGVEGEGRGAGDGGDERDYLVAEAAVEGGDGRVFARRAGADDLEEEGGRGAAGEYGGGDVYGDGDSGGYDVGGGYGGYDGGHYGGRNCGNYGRQDCVLNSRRSLDD